MNLGNKSNCTCCFTCEHRQINQRFGYIIPCKDRRECSKYLELLEQSKLASEREKQESTAKRAARDSEHYRCTHR